MLSLRRFSVVGVAVALVATALAYGPEDTAEAVPAAPTWGAVVTITEDGQNVDVVVDPAGNATVVWVTRGRRAQVRAVRRPAGGAWGAPVTLGRGDPWVAPQVVSDARGNLTAVWSRTRRNTTTGVVAARRPHAGDWGRPVRLSHDIHAEGYVGPENEGIYGAGYIDLANTAAGAAVVTWEWGSGDRYVPFRVQAAYRPIGGGWQGVENVTRRGAGSRPVAAVGPHGGVEVVYGLGHGLAARHRAPSGRWAPPAQLAREGHDPKVAIGPRGRALVVFGHYEHRAYGFGSTVKAVHRTATGPWSKRRTISAGERHSGSPELAMDGRGAVVVAWTVAPRGPGKNYVRVIRRTSGGVWRDAVKLPSETAYPGDEGLLDLAGNAHGDVLVVSLVHQRNGDVEDVVIGRLRSRGSSWSAGSEIVEGYPWVLSASVDRAGGAVVAWWVSETLVQARDMVAP